MAARDQLKKAAAALVCPAKVGLRLSPTLSTPLLMGLRKPVIVLPERMAAPDYEEELPAILAHELSHMRSHDLAWAGVFHLLHALLWFHPLAWRARGAHTAACEGVSDAVAAQYVGGATEYSRTLARVALEMVSSPPVAAGIPMARSSNLRGRIEALRRRLYTAPLARPLVVLALMLGGVAIVGLGGSKLVFGQIETQEIPRGAPLAEESLALPEFYGLYAFSGASTVKLSRETVDSLDPAAEFLLFDKEVVYLARGWTVLPVDGAPVVPPRPNDAPIQCRTKAVSGQPEMLRIIPVSYLRPGFYVLVHASETNLLEGTRRSRDESRGFVVFGVGLGRAELDQRIYSAGAMSRISRVRADLRSLATAIESYFIDNNAYPAWTTDITQSIDETAARSHPDGQWDIPMFRRKLLPEDPLMTLSTPISYITHLFSDPFADSPGRKFAFYSVDNPVPGWLAWSAGPDGDYDLDWSHYVGGLSPPPSILLKTYDPTNGVTSDGDIWRLGGGRRFAPPESTTIRSSVRPGIEWVPLDPQ